MSDEDKSGSEPESDDDLGEGEEQHKEGKEGKEGKDKDKDDKTAEKKKQSLGMSMKKWAMSKTAETKMGRKAIGHFLGDQGVHILAILKSVTTKDVGEAKAKELKRRILKLVLKAKLLVDNKQLRDTDVEHIIDPLNHLLMAFHTRLRISVASDTARAQQGASSSSSSSSSSAGGGGGGAPGHSTSTSMSSIPSSSTSSLPSGGAGAGSATNGVGGSGGGPFGSGGGPFSTLPGHAMSISIPEYTDGRAKSVCLSPSASMRVAQRSYSVTLDVGLLVANMHRIQLMVQALLKPHISEKNMVKLKQVMGYLSGKQLLVAFFNHPSMAKDRAELCEAMSKLMEDLYEETNTAAQGGALRIYGAEPDSVDLCRSKDCKEPRLAPTPTFPGSKYCALHYEDQFQALHLNPSVIHFLEEDGVDEPGFMSWEGFKNNAAAIKFYQAVGRYRLVTQSIRRLFGDELYEKYLRNGTGPVAEVVAEEVKSGIQRSLALHKEQRTVPPVELFDDAQKAVLTLLESIFQQGFIASPEFKRYIAEKNAEDS